MKYSEFEQMLKRDLPNFSLKEVGYSELTLNHTSENAVKYDFCCGVYVSSVLNLFKFSNNDIVIMYYENGDKSNGRVVDEEDYDLVMETLEDAYNPNGTSISFKDLKSIVESNYSELKIEPAGTIQLNRKSYAKFLFTVAVEGLKDRLKSDNISPEYVVCVDSEDAAMIVKFEDVNQGGVLYLDVATIIRTGNYEKVFNDILSKAAERGQVIKKSAEESEKREKARAEATAKARAASKPTIEQRIKWAEAEFKNYKKRLRELNDGDDDYVSETYPEHNPKTPIYCDCYAGEDICSTDEDDYDAYIVISAWGGMMTDDYEWSEASLKVVEAAFPEYEFIEAMEGLYNIYWKGGDGLNIKEIKEVNKIISQIPCIDKWEGERDYEKEIDDEDGDDEENDNNEGGDNNPDEEMIGSCNMNVKLRVGGRKAPRGGWSHLEKYAHNYDDEDYDPDNDFGFRDLLEKAKVWKDLSKVEFRYDNWEYLGHGQTKDGIDYLYGWACGDCEPPLGLFIYWDGKSFRGYVPIKGNTVNTINMTALGLSDDDADIKYFLKEFGITIEDQRDFIDRLELNWDAMLEDFESRLEVTD